jgi:NhaA family Na+:H+ antiporter
MIGEDAAVRRPIERLIRPFQEFAAQEASGGILLLAATFTALAWVNSPWAAAYFALWHTTITMGVGASILSRDLHFWVNEGLMSLFFFVVGLEIKRELVMGELATPRRAALPIVAAIGGVAVPALIYSAFNLRGPGAPGWGIPMATDIAFVMGVMALLGRRVPMSLKVFMMALAIVDDIAAVAVIAVFYTSHIAWGALGIGALCLVALLGVNRLAVRHPLPYALLGIFLWGAILQSGIHATIAGVLLAMTVPCRTEPRGPVKRMQSPLLRWEHGLHPWVTFLIMPLFALANAGIVFNGDVFKSLLQPVSLGIVLGLFLGKPVGITLAAWLAVRARLSALPDGINWIQLNAAGWLGGIGFTMSIFVAGLAFSAGSTTTNDAVLSTAKLGIFTASLLAGLAGSLLMLAKSARLDEHA